jgi:hypothetical protein
MSYFTIAKGLTGEVPDTPLSLAQTKVAEALGYIYDQMDWSFQRAITYGGWLCPGMIANVGTYTTTPYSPEVIADATATAILANRTGMPLITTLQFRNPAYSIYNIIGYLAGDDPTNPNAPFATLTLDRPWMEPTQGPGQSYYIYQAYFAAPVKDFRKFIEVRDTMNDFRLNFWGMTQSELAVRDPQRTNFSDPDYVVAAGIDNRVGSSTFGYQLFELWPQQLSYVPYSFSYRRRGIIPETPQDFYTLSPPYPLTDEIVRWRSINVLYQYKSAQMEAKTPGAGRGFTLLAQMAIKEYAACLDKILAIDLNLNNEEFNRIENRGRRDENGDYSNQLGQLHIGGYPGY